MILNDAHGGPPRRSFNIGQKAKRSVFLSLQMALWWAFGRDEMILTVARQISSSKVSSMRIQIRHHGKNFFLGDLIYG